MKERKSNLLTIRITDDEKESLDYLCDSIGKSKSDAITRACMYFLNTRPDDMEGYLEDNIGGGVGSGVGGSGTDEKRSLRTVRVHARMSDSIAEGLKNRGLESGEGLSRTVRKAIKAFASVNGRHY